MESALIWSAVVLLAVAFVVPYAIRFQRRTRHDRDRRDEAVAMGVDRPAAQHPIVDELACVGCGACVDACPEGDVLGVVSGRAVIVNGLRCVGHGLCAEACPVGALTVGLADIRERNDIPLLDEYGQTTVPGIYVAGELGGFALIRNAILEGRKVVDHIASCLGPGGNGVPRRRSAAGYAIDDVIVVGAGPAGTAAALSAKAHGLSCRILDRERPGGTMLHYPRRKLVLTQPVELPLHGALDAEEYTKEALLEIWSGIHSRHGLHTEVGRTLTDVKRVDDRFEVRTTDGVFEGRFVVLALGRHGTPRKLAVPGEDRSKVMYRLLDAASYRDQRILVVGGGDSAVEASIALARQPGNAVTLSYRKPKLVRIKRRNAERIEPLLAAGQIRAELGSEVIDIGETAVRLRTPAGEKVIPNDHVFVFAGGEPPFELLRKIGIAFRGGPKAPSHGAAVNEPAPGT
jgi:thioredoxin reductase